MALQWYRRAADHGDPGAELNLALLYESGTAGAPQDSLKAEQWLQKAAAQGYPRGAVGLADFDMRKQPPDYTAALAWYQKAADQEADLKSRATADEALAKAYEAGLGVGPDMNRANYWRSRATADRSQN